MNHKYLNCLAIIPVLTLIFFFYANPISAQTGIPPGSYKKTCKDIQVMPGYLLWALCEKADGSYEKSTLQFTKCDGDISNSNGKLSCKHKSRKQPPNGSYKKTCKDIRVDGKQLKAATAAEAQRFQKAATRIVVKTHMLKENGFIQIARRKTETGIKPRSNIKTAIKT